MMNRFCIAYLFLLLFYITACSKGDPVLAIEGGSISGIKSGTPGVLVFKGIPYAAPPVGVLRWKEPHPVLPWSGIKIADTFGNASIQPDQEKGGFYQHEFYQSGDPVRSEDCLYLNVWTPAAGKIEEKLPVAMYIHGGGFAHGFGDEIEFDGEAWAKRGVILVTINYRLGPLGFFTHPSLTSESPTHASGNQGILDQIAALKWIKNNIGQFGGDPENVTVFGQSAGAVAVAYLCTSPLSSQLVDKAIIMSGGGVYEKDLPGFGPPNIDDAGAMTKEMFDHYSMMTLGPMQNYPAEDLLTLSARYREDLLKQQGITLPNFGPGRVTDSETVKAGGYQSYSELMGSMLANGKPAANVESKPINPTPMPPPLRVPRWSPIIDGYSIKESVSDAVRAERLAKIPYMIGSVSNDVAILAQGIDQFCLLAEQMGVQTYAYQFAREVPGDDAGAFHSGELWYVFNTYRRSWRNMTPADSVLSERMVDAWTNFAKNGSPDPTQKWKPFTKNNQQIYVFDIEK